MTSPESGRSPRPPAALPRTAEQSASAPASMDAGTELVTRQRTQVLHELLRIRRQAEAARLEAQASRLDASAEQLESLLERIDAGEAIAPVQLRELGIDEAAAADSVQHPLRSPVCAPENEPFQTAKEMGSVAPELTSDVVRFQSWESIREAQSHGDIHRVRQDDAHRSVRPPHVRWRTDREDTDGEDADETLPAAPSSASDDHDIESLASAPVALVPAPLAPAPLAETQSTTDDLDGDVVRDELPEDAEPSSSGSPPSPAVFDESLVLQEQSAAPPQRRSTAVVTSAIVHLILLLCLAGFTLNTVMPKDQIALAASASESTEETIQTFEIETAQPENVTSETAPDETAIELDPLGEMAVVEVHADAIGAMSPPTTPSFSRGTAALSAAVKARGSDSNSKMQFCGVEGGGNHFVYLVDSSGSMGDAFISARRALLDSINMLNPEQRFYVIFFDAECDYMRITRADQDESRSVQATPANKQRLRSWAMRVEMDRGKAPYEPLEYALQKLKPDVIFLLSDGEFPQRIEDLLQTENKVTNLFGETKPISIIHTISYYSREGESRMRRIAENNFGQYRHIPKP